MGVPTNVPITVPSTRLGADAAEALLAFELLLATGSSAKTEEANADDKLHMTKEILRILIVL